VREWLIANKFQGKDGQSVPEMTDEKVLEISNRYIELYENVSGEKFVAQAGEDAIGRIESNIKLYFGI
jgi:phosphoribosylaminoimidazole-succinocarboxamide synthase